MCFWGWTDGTAALLSCARDQRLHQSHGPACAAVAETWMDVRENHKYYVGAHGISRAGQRSSLAFLECETAACRFHAAFGTTLRITFQKCILYVLCRIWSPTTERHPSPHGSTTLVMLTAHFRPKLLGFVDCDLWVCIRRGATSIRRFAGENLVILQKR